MACSSSTTTMRAECMMRTLVKQMNSLHLRRQQEFALLATQVIQLFAFRRQNDVEDARLIGLRPDLLAAQRDNQRFLDELIGLVVRIALEEELGDQCLVARMADGIVNVAGPPG